MLRLHSFDRSPFSWKTRLVLAEKKIPYVVVVPENKASDPAFGKLNPFRLTPVLELEDGRTIYESTVVNEYLEEAWPDPPLMPRDPLERARIRMIEDTTDQYFYQIVRAAFVTQFEAVPPVVTRKKPEMVDAKAVEEAVSRCHEHMRRLESVLEGRVWFGGGVFSLADIALVPILTGSLPLMGMLPDLRYPGITAWVEKVRARPSWAEAAPKQPLTLMES